MSWQCPICETVNHDVTPVCTVCDNIAPVIESYLSLESIDLLRKYNEKLDAIHALEAEGNFEEMLNTAMEAISLYKENSLALDKAKHALLHLNQSKLKKQISGILDNAIEKKDFALASSLFKLIDSFDIDALEYATSRSEVRTQLSRKNDIEEILDESYKAIIELDTSKALQIVEEGLAKYPSSKLLQRRRDDIKLFICAITSLKTKDNGKKKYPKFPPRIPPTEESKKQDDSSLLESVSRRKFPKVTRKMK